MPERFYYPFGWPTPLHPPGIFYSHGHVFYDPRRPHHFAQHHHLPLPHPLLMTLPPPPPPHRPQLPHPSFVPLSPGARMDGVGFERLRIEGPRPRDRRTGMGGGCREPWAEVPEGRRDGHRRWPEHRRRDHEEEEDDDHEGKVVGGWGWEHVRLRGGGCDSDEAERDSSSKSSGSGGSKSGKRRGRKGGKKGKNMTVEELQKILEEEEAGYGDATTWEEWSQGGIRKRDGSDDEVKESGSGEKKHVDE